MAEHGLELRLPDSKYSVLTIPFGHAGVVLNPS